jgi:heme/copper-type cytochrome/quinol oxidase subunit 3
MGLTYREHGLLGLTLAILFGIWFTYLQATEYYMSSFCIRDGVYGSSFYLLTGFHGLHVQVGTIFLIVC